MTIIWQNVWSWPNRVMARYLRRRGWVVFYLDEQSRHCGEGKNLTCWLALYQDDERRGDR